MISEQPAPNPHTIDQQQQPEHRAALPGGAWALWRWAGVRGTGFPAEQMLQLADPACAAAADRLIEADATLAATEHAGRHALEQVLLAGNLTADQGRLLKNALRQLNKRSKPEALPNDSPIQPVIDTFVQALAEFGIRQAAFDQAFVDAIMHQSHAIYRVANDPHFREAVIWQNRHAARNTFDSIRQNPPGSIARTSKWRGKEALVAKYLQRYCTKNDTIGFFGPVGWAKIVSRPNATVVQPGPQLLAQRQILFEHWGIEILAETLGRNNAIRPWIVPRRSSTVALQGNIVHMPFAQQQLSDQAAAILHACGKGITAKSLAQQLLAAPASDFTTEQEIYTLLEKLRRMGILVWDFEIPIMPYPEQHLRRQLENIGDAQARLLSLRALDLFEKMHGSIAQAVGNPERLDAALTTLETIFTRITNTAPTHAAGKTYAARTLVHEDCRRDVEVQMGQEFLDILGPPLSLLLDSARWLTWAGCSNYQQRAREIYLRLTAQSGARALPFVDFWIQFEPLLYRDTEQIIAPSLGDFQKRWADILALPAGQRRVSYSCDELRPKIQAAFGTPTTNWLFPIYHAPDVLIAAAEPTALQRGDYQLVMGELHMACNTLEPALFVHQHPDPQQLIRARANDHPQPRVLMIPPKGWPGAAVRFYNALALPQDYYLAFSYDTSSSPSWQTLPIGELLIEDLGQGLVIRSVDPSICLDADSLIADLVSEVLIGRFTLLPPQAHRPRLSYDRLVVAREQWRLPAQALTFADRPDERERFLGARQLAHEHGLPRWVFVKAPLEQKVFFVDFASPVLIDLFASIVRRSKEQDGSQATIVVTEMLPDFSQLWLVDSQQQHYTSELRLIAVDQRRCIDGIDQ